MKRCLGIILLLIIVVIVVGWRREEKKEVVEIPKIVVKAEPRELYKFAVMADVHNDNEELKKALELAKNDGDKLVVIAGDMTINGGQKELDKVKTTLDESQVRYAVVPGNHDLYQNKFVEVFGKEWQTIEGEGYKLILINNGSWRGLGEEQKIWIENDIQGCNVVKCVAVMHMPLDHNLTKHVMGEGSTKVTVEARWLEKTLVDNKVETMYAGHLHYAGSYTMAGLRTNLVGAMSRTRNNQTPRFTEVVIYDNGDIKNEIKIVDD